MKFTDLFIRRPVLAIVLNLVILVAGIQAIKTLNARQYPKLDSATVVVTTVYVGANADLVRGFITTPLERAIAAADGIDYIESSSVQGLSTINVRLKLNFPAGDALSDISARVNQVRADLPPDAQVPAISIQPSDAAFASMYLSFGSSILAENQVTDYLLRIVQPRLSAIDGVQRADILGGRQFAIRAWLKPERMAALNVSPSQVHDALAANNYLSAVGQTMGQLTQLNLTAATDLKSLDEFRKLVIKNDGTTLVRLQDIANVEMGGENYDQEVKMSGKPATFMGVWVLPSANSLDVIRKVKKEMETIQQELPTGMTGIVAYDATEYIDSAIHEVTDTLVETILIVMIVIFMFIGSLRTVLVPVVAIPVSLIGAVFLMQVFGFTLNLLTLLAIVLSVGLVVDDAIVVVENVDRHINDGKKPYEAALLGARELVGPVIAMTITLAAVYTPIGFQGGLTGALFREFAFTLAGAVFISGIVALTLSPMMCSRLLKPAEGHRWLTRQIDRVFNGIRDTYLRALDVSLGMRGAVYAGWIVLSLLIVPMYMFSPQELAPNEDQGVVFTSFQTPANATLEQMSVYSTEVRKIWLAVPETDQTFQITGATSGFGGLVTKEWTKRKRNIFDIQNEVTPKMAAVPGVRAPAFLPQPLPSPGLMPIEFVISSTADHQQILQFAQKLQQAAAESGQFFFPPFMDVLIDQEKADIELDRDKISSMGLNMAKVGSDLSAMLGGNYVNRFNIDGRSYKVIPQVERAERLTTDQLLDIHVSGPGNTLIPLSSIASIKTSVEPRTLNRFQQLNAIKLSGMANSVDTGLKVLEAKAKEILPEGYHVDYTGGSRQLRTESGKFLPAMGLAVLLIFLVLAAQFNSFRDPLVVLTGSVPLAMFGALIFTFLKFPGPPGMVFKLTQGWTTTLNIYSQVGLVTLVGLVAKNGILIVEFANERQLEGMSKFDAVREAAKTRLRPILMTTVATISGHFPLTLVTGAGAVARNSIGIVLVGGMFVGTFFTLFVVPSVYILIAKDHSKERAHDQARESSPPPAPVLEGPAPEMAE